MQGKFKFEFVVDKDFFHDGIKAYRNGDNNSAIGLLTKASEEDEHNPKVWNALGVVLSKSGNNISAEKCFENALILDPGNITYEKNADKIKNKKSILSVPALEQMDSNANKQGKKSQTSCENIKTFYSILLGLSGGLLIVGILLGGNASPIALGFLLFSIVVLGILYGINSIFQSPTLSFLTGLLGIGLLVVLFLSIISAGMLSSAYTASIKGY